MYYLNLIEAYRNIIAIADEDLVGKVFLEGDLQLDVKESFYKGELMNEEEILTFCKNWIREDATFNIVGPRAISLLKEAGFIDESSIKNLAGIPYSMILI
mgnify:CR=1 FL=1